VPKKNRRKKQFGRKRTLHIIRNMSAFSNQNFPVENSCLSAFLLLAAKKGGNSCWRKGCWWTPSPSGPQLSPFIFMDINMIPKKSCSKLPRPEALPAGNGVCNATGHTSARKKFQSPPHPPSGSWPWPGWPAPGQWANYEGRGQNGIFGP